MWRVIAARLHQKHRTLEYPKGPTPELPDRFAGWPHIDPTACSSDCDACQSACPNGALHCDDPTPGLWIDLGRCLFCRECERQCPTGSIRFTQEHRLAAAQREDLKCSGPRTLPIDAKNALAEKLFRNSLKLRQVSCGGCNACEADCNVLSTVAWDLGRFGIQFVASPRHADGILVTGPVTENMRVALLKTWEAVPSPKIVIAVGVCAISGGPYVGHPEAHDGLDSLIPVDLYIPGCPPHPLTILDGLLRFLGRIP